MSTAEQLPDTIAAAATALGVLGADGNVDSGFFDRPLKTVGGMLTDARRRQALLDAVADLIEAESTEPVAGGERRRYPIVNERGKELALVLAVGTQPGGPDVTIVLAVRALLDGDDNEGLTAELEVPLVRAAGTAVEAVCGRPGDGAIVLRLRYRMRDGLSVAATASAHSGGGTIGARVEGIVIEGTELAPLEVSSDSLGTDAVELLTRLLQAGGALLTGDDAAARVLAHVPGLLGLDDPRLALPLLDLVQGRATWREWFARLAADGAAGLRAWLGHLAGLVDRVPGFTADPPTPDAPWTIRLHEGLPDLDLCLALAADAAGTTHLQARLRARMDAPAPADARLEAEALLADLPLAGAAAPTWFGSGRVVLLAPATEGVRLAPPGPATTAPQAFAVGRLRGGVSWNGAVTPLLELNDVTIDGHSYPRLDLADADTLADTAKDELEHQLRTLLGDAPVAGALLVLAGLEPTGGQGVDLSLLATRPTAAIACLHRALLDAGVWQTGPLRAIATLFGVPAGQALDGDGTSATPWRVPLTAEADGLRLWLTASTATDGTARELELGLRLAAADGHIKAGLDALAVRFDGDAVALRALDSVWLGAEAGEVAEGPLQAAGATLRAGWSVPSGLTCEAAIRGLALTGLDLGLGDGPALDVALGDLRLLPWRLNATAADLGLGIDPDALGTVAGWALERLADALKPPLGVVARALAGSLDELLGTPPRLDRLAADPALVARAVLRAVVTAPAGDEDEPFAAELGGLLADAAGALFLGAGAGADPWRLALDPQDAGGAALTAWLSPDGPPAGPPPDRAADIDEAVAALGDDDPLPALALDAAAAMAAAAAVDPELRALTAGRDTGAVGDGLAALAALCDGGDGLLPADATAAPAGWSTITVTGPITVPFSDPAPVADQLDQWVAVGAPLVLVAPAWWPGGAWLPLITELMARHGDWTWQAVDLRRDPLAALAAVTPASATVVTTSDPTDPQLATALTALAAGAAPALLAVDPPAALLTWAAAQPGLPGLMTLGVRFAADPEPDRWDAAAEAVRAAAPLLAEDAAFAGLAAAWRELVDGQTAADPARPAGAGRLTPAGLTAASALPALGAVPRAAIVAQADGRALLAAVQAAAGRRTRAADAPAAAVHGVSASLPLPPAGAVRAAVTARVDLGAHGLSAAAPAAPATVVVTGTLERTGGWLTGPPSATRPAAVRRLAITVTAPLGGTPGTDVRLELQDTMLAGVRTAACTPESPGFAELFSALLAALPAGDAHVDAALRLLADHLGVVRRAGAVWQLDVAGLDRLLGDPAGTVAARAQPLLASGLLGLAPDPQAPAGVTRLTRALSDRLRATLEPATGRLTVATTGDGIALGLGARLEFAAVADLATGAVSTTWTLGAQGLVLARAGDGGVRLTLPGDPAPLALFPAPDPAQLAARVLPALPAALGAGLGSVLLEQWFAQPVPPHVLMPWLTDPRRALAARVQGGAIAVLAADVARAAGLPVDDAGAITLLPGILRVGVTVDPAAGVTLRAETPSSGWSPAPGLGVALAAGIAVDPSGAVTPSGSLGLTVDLDQAAGSGGWGTVGLQFAVDAAGPRLSLLPGTGTPIEIVPRFSGLGSVLATAERFLPRVLDALVGEVPDGTLKHRALALATALEVYGPTFAAAPVPLRGLTVDRLRDRAGAIASKLADLAGDALASAAGTQVAVSPLPDGVSVALSPVAGGTLTLELACSGQPKVTVTLGSAALDPLAATITMSAAAAPAGVTLQGHVTLALDLGEALRITPAPTFAIALAADGSVSANLVPMPDLAAGEAEIDLLPQPRVVVSPAARLKLAERWLVAPGFDLVLRLLDDRGVLAEAIADGGPTWQDVLESAGLLDGGRVKVPLDPLRLPNAGLAFADAVQLPVGDNLVVRIARDDPGGGGPVGIGFAFTGRIVLPAGGDVAPSIVLGTKGPPADGGLELLVLRGQGTSWLIQPELRLDRTGVNASGPLGKPLLSAGPVTLGGVEGRLILDVGLSSGGSLTVGDVGGELLAVDLGLPAVGGGGGNAAASSLLAPAGGSGAKVNPPLSAGLRYTKATGLSVVLEGLTPGEVRWIPINQAFGPLHIAQIGLLTDTGTFHVDNADRSLPFLGVLVDGGVELGPLALAVKGLGVELPVQYVSRPQTWKLTLDGLAVSFDGAGVTIAGGLERGESGGVLEYRGFLVVRAFGFGASAIGAYADMAGTPSFYAFAAINATIGGPPYLFITGLAGGMGFNRTLATPVTPEQVPGFPLVAVMNDQSPVDPDALLARMGDAIRPSKGSYWFAAGLQFTTFELVHTIALGYVAITPAGFEIGLLGLMSAPLPSADSKIAELELGLLARYSSSDRTLAVMAQLTRNSWLFTQNCRLTGGFAFMVWFSKPQTVLTVGGYGPLYQPPSYFPQVLEVGFRWQVSDSVVIKGGAYYALTPEVMTVGGRLEASADFSAGYAHVTVYAHAALWFWPPHFVLEAGFRATGKICGFGFDVGCDVHVELPPLWGRVTVHFMGSHRFDFGHRQDELQFLSSLAEFVERFLGGAAQVHQLDVPAGILVPGTRVDGSTTGSSRPAGTQADPWLVTPEFTLATITSLPSVRATLNGQAVAHVAGGRATVGALYAIPLGAHPDLQPEHRIAISRVDGQPMPPASWLSVEATTTGVASGIYATDSGAGTVDPPGATQGKDVLDLALGGTRITAATQVADSAAAGIVTLAGLVEEEPPGDLPLAAAPVAAAPRRAAAAPPAAALERPAPPRMRWASGNGGARGNGNGGAADAPLDAHELQLWDLPHVRPATRVAVEGRPRRLVAFGMMGEVLHDAVPQASTPLPARTVAVALAGEGPALASAGWQAGTRLLPVTRWVFIAPGATVELAAIAHWPAHLAAERGIPADRVLSRGAPGAVTRFADGVTVETVVVSLDARRADAGLGDVAVGVEGGTLGSPRELRHGGRLTLVYEAAPADGARLAVSVVLDPAAWALRGVAGLAGDAAGWEARLAANPWERLLDQDAAAATPPTAVTRAAAPARTAFQLIYEEEPPQ